MASTEQVIRSWEAATDLLTGLAEQGVSGRRRRRGKVPAAESMCDALIICLASFDMQPPAPATT